MPTIKSEGRPQRAVQTHLQGNSGTSRAAIVSTTMVYPTPWKPTQGIFVRRRLCAIHAIRPVVVVSPQPWFPVVKPVRSAEGIDRETPPAFRPRMFYFPGILKNLDARFYARSFRAALEEIRNSEPVEAIDAHFEWPDGVGASIVAKELDLPLIVTLRGKLLGEERGQYQRMQIAESIGRANGVIAVSQSLADEARRLCGRKLDISVIPNGVDGAIFHRTVAGGGRYEFDAAARRELGWDLNARYVVSVGHWQRLKGFHRLVEVWPEVCRNCGDVRLVLVGGAAGQTGYERELRRLVRRVNNGMNARRAESILIAGAQTPGRIATMLNAADVFSLASRSEGWCNAISEALACGCPVVATAVGGNCEIVTDSELGILVPPGDSSALRNALVAALARTWNRVAIASRGGVRSWDDVARACSAVFDKAIEHQARRSWRTS